MWPAAFRGVVMMPVRTNNHVEGWHRRFNSRAGRGQLQLYILVPLLHKDASLVTPQL